jgi:hypothetical protein
VIKSHNDVRFELSRDLLILFFLRTPLFNWTWMNRDHLRLGSHWSNRTWFIWAHLRLGSHWSLLLHRTVPLWRTIHHFNRTLLLGSLLLLTRENRSCVKFRSLNTLLLFPKLVMRLCFLRLQYLAITCDKGIFVL